LLTALRATTFCYCNIPKILQSCWYCKTWLLLVFIWVITLICETHLKTGNPKALHKWVSCSPIHSSSCVQFSVPHTNTDFPLQHHSLLLSLIVGNLLWSMWKWVKLICILLCSCVIIATHFSLANRIYEWKWYLVNSFC
jgi:hypothetical protein